MYLSTLNLNQFRCFDSLRVKLEPGISLFHGNNAQGKTSILEAMCVLLRLQSPRTSALADCAKFGGEEFAVGGTLSAPHDESELRIQHRKGRRRLFVDGEHQGRGAAYLRYSSLVVWMANDDLALVRGGGEGRRRYLDFIASQLFPPYLPALKAYEKALRSRNFLLKRDASPKWPEIDAYTRILDEQGKVITQVRREIVTQLSPFANAAQKEISCGGEEIRLVYESASGPDDEIGESLLANRDNEFKKRRTLFGPHLDDLALLLNEMPAAKFASEGQQRTLALSLKLAQTRLFVEMQRQAPLLLIDDVFGELDPERRNALMAAWPADSQKLITTTNLDWLDDEFREAHRFHVEAAGITQAE